MAISGQTQEGVKVSRIRDANLAMALLSIGTALFLPSRAIALSDERTKALWTCDEGDWSQDKGCWVGDPASAAVVEIASSGKVSTTTSVVSKGNIVVHGNLEIEGPGLCIGESCIAPERVTAEATASATVPAEEPHSPQQSEEGDTRIPYTPVAISDMTAAMTWRFY